MSDLDVDVWYTRYSVYLIDKKNWRYLRRKRVDGEPDGGVREILRTKNMIDDQWLELDTTIPENERVVVMDDPHTVGHKCLQIRYKGSHTGLITSTLDINRNN